MTIGARGKSGKVGRVFTLFTEKFTRLDITLEKISKTEALIKVTLTEADYQPAVNQKIKDYSKKANIKGFRPGKVPEGIIRSMYGKALKVEEINHMLSHKVMDYIRQSDLQFLGEPLPNREKADRLDWEDQKDFDFEYNVGFANEFELPVDKKLKIERYTIKIDDSVLNETIENLQRQFGEPEMAETVGERDFIYGPIVSADGAINREIKIDMREVEKGLAKKLKGTKIDEVFAFEAKKLYGNPVLLKHQLGLTDDEFKKIKGKLTLTIKGIERIKEVPVGQDLFDKTFGPGKVDSEQAFRAKVKEEVAKSYAREEETYFNYKVRELLIEKAKIELPDTFLKKWLQTANEDMTEEILAKEYTSYADELRWSLIRNKIVKNQQIKVEYEDVVSEAKALIRNQFTASGLSEGIEEHLEAFANNYLQAEKGENYMKVHNQVQNRKVMEHIYGEITIKDKEISLEAFRKLD